MSFYIYMLISFPLINSSIIFYAYFPFSYLLPACFTIDAIKHGWLDALNSLTCFPSSDWMSSNSAILVVLCCSIVWCSNTVFSKSMFSWYFSSKAFWICFICLSILFTFNIINKSFVIMEKNQISQYFTKTYIVLESDKFYINWE